MTNPIPESFDRRVVAGGLDHVEGVCWDAKRRCLWAGGEAGQLYRIGLFGTKRVMGTIEGGALLGMALDHEHFLYVCDPGNQRVWRVDGHGVAEPFGLLRRTDRSTLRDRSRRHDDQHHATADRLRQRTLRRRHDALRHRIECAGGERDAPEWWPLGNAHRNGALRPRRSRDRRRRRTPHLLLPAQPALALDEGNWPRAAL